MSTPLTGQRIDQSYGDIVQVSNAGYGIDATSRKVSSGLGTDSALALGTNIVTIQPSTTNGSVLEVKNLAGSVLFTINTSTNTITANSGVKFVGDGSLLTSVPSVGSGGTTSEVALTLQADSNNGGTAGEDIIMKIGTKVVGRIPNTYAASLPSGVEGNYFLKTVSDNFAPPVGGAILNGSTQYYSHVDNTNLNFGTGDFSLGVYFNVYSTSSGFGMIGSLTDGVSFYDLRLTSLGILSLDIYNSGTKYTISCASAIEANKNYHLVITRGTSPKLYLNGAEMATTLNEISGKIFTFTGVKLFGDSPHYASFNGKFYFSNFYNYALTQAEVTERWNNGQPHLYVEPYATRDASNTVLTSGTLVIGKRYILKTFVSGDDFTNVATVLSGTINTTGCVFIAKATTPTTWTNSSEVMSEGLTFSANYQDAGTNGWKVKVGGVTSIMNSTASPIAAGKGAYEVYTDARALIATATPTTMSIPKGYVIREIRALGSAGLTAIKIGTSSSGEQIVASTTTTGTTPKILTLAATARDAYSESADTPIYVEHTTAGQTMNVILIFERVGA